MMLDRQSSSFELTLSLFAVIVLLLGVSVWLLIPETKTYLHLQDETRTAVQTTDRIQMEYDRLYEEKASTEAEAAALSERFENRAEAEDVLAWVRKFLNEAEMVSAAPDGTFALRVRVASPAAFYGFVDQLDSAPWVLRLLSPVVMQAEAGGIAVAFTLRVATPAAVPPPLQK